MKTLSKKRMGVLFFLVFAGLTIARVRAASSKDEGSSTPLRAKADIEEVTRVERAMGDAMVAVDIAKLDQIFADDWASVGDSGKIVTKERVLEDFKSGNDKLVSYGLGQIDVKISGDLAVAHGTVTEKRIQDGKDVSGEGVYMDLLKKRGGKWVVVRSGGAIIRK